MKNILWGASALIIALSACSKNESLEGLNGTPIDGKVRFAATTNRTIGRAANDNPITGTQGLQENIKKFHVTGFINTGGAQLLDTDVNWTGASWEYADEPYWPSTEVNFFAYANWATAPTVASTGITTTGTLIAEDKMDESGQKDLLVAAEYQANKSVRTTLTFKHALTQIVFKTGNLDAAKLQVRIGGARIVNVANSGDLGVTAASTGAQIAWSNQANLTSKYHVQGLQVITQTDFDNVQVPAATAPFTVEAVNGTTPYADYKQLQTAQTGNNALMLVPQTFEAWNPNDTDKPAATTKAYIELLAIINDPAKTSSDTDAGDAAFYYCGTPKQGATGAADEYGKIYIPIESKASDINEWVAGKRISYIITFGDKGSGSGGGGYDENNEPILVPIKFKAVVEDWVDVDVPLLTASFSANSNNITATFIDGFTNQLLNDIAAAKEEKTYRANIKISGSLLDDAVLTFSPTQAVNDNIATGSTVTYDFVDITSWAATKTISMAVPAGWKADSYLGANTSIVTSAAATATISVEGTLANKIVLTKIDVIP